MTIWIGLMNLSGSPFDFISAFFAGALVSFTPCIYPLIPMSVAYIGASGAKSRLRGLGLSLVYVAGVSLIYAILGVAAVFSGRMFGHFSTLPQVRIIAGLIIVFFGFSLYKGEGINLPILKLPILKKPASFFSCFIFGLGSGLVISPCVFPVLGAILIYVAASRNFLYGALVLFSFAYGMGLLLIIAGTFSSFLALLPKSGRWMQAVKRVFAAMLMVLGLYFIASATRQLVYAQEAIRDLQPEVDFTLYDIEGNAVTLSEFRGEKSIVLFFWTTWCPHCPPEFRYLKEAYPLLSENKIEVLAVNIQESAVRINRFIEQLALPFKVLLDSQARVSSDYRIIGVPTYLLINKEGKIVFRGHSFPRHTYKEILKP